MFDLILNISLGVVGLTALTLTLYNNKWGPVVGLFSQPLWFTVGWRSGAWSICILSFAYGISWCIGIKRMWKER